MVGKTTTAGRGERLRFIDSQNAAASTDTIAWRASGRTQGVRADALDERRTTIVSQGAMDLL